MDCSNSDDSSNIDMLGSSLASCRHDVRSPKLDRKVAPWSGFYFFFCFMIYFRSFCFCYVDFLFVHYHFQFCVCVFFVMLFFHFGNHSILFVYLFSNTFNFVKFGV